MRSILYTSTVLLLSSADLLQFIQAYSAIPLMRHRSATGISLSIVAGRRFSYRSAIRSSVSTLPSVESSKMTTEFSLGKPFSGLIADFKRRLPYYKSDWTDGFRKKSLAAILFLYFACLAPTVAFGGLTNIITNGHIGVIEFIISCGAGGMFYSLFSGQPMTFVGPTGLTLAFTAALYKFTEAAGLPFLAMYSWTGIWTSLLMALSAVFNLSSLIKYCTRFTDDCFNALLATNFLYEAGRTLFSNFSRSGADLASAFAALNMAVATWVTTNGAAKFKQTSKIGNSRFRQLISDFGPSFVIVCMSILAAQPFISNSVFIEKLVVPKTFSLAKGRAWMPDLMSVSPSLRIASMLPAVLLTMLFYLDQNISVRAVNACNLKKGEAYHQDLLVLSIIVFTLSFFGLPWVCGATVQSLNHVRSMANVRLVSVEEVEEEKEVEKEVVSIDVGEDRDGSVQAVADSTSVDVSEREREGEEKRGGGSGNGGFESEEGLAVATVDVKVDVEVLAKVADVAVGTGSRTRMVVSEEFADVIETRLTGFVIHAAILFSLFLLPFLGNIPIPVISGIFLYLGKKMMKGNLFLERLGNIIIEKRLLPKSNIFNQLPTPTVLKYLCVQFLMLALIWVMKQNKNFSLFFPSCIGFLMIVRSYVMPNFFSPTELQLLDPEM